MGILRNKKRIFLIISMLALLLSGVAALSDSHRSTEAGMFCGKIGSSTDRNKVGGALQGSANKDSANREWTAEELFKNSVSFSTYYGEGPNTWWYADTSERGAGVDGYEEVKSKLEANRGCFTMDFIPNLNLGITSIITGITGMIILTLVGEDFTSETLGTIVGGTGGDDGGLIGTFMNSFYMPLVVLSATIMVFTLVYKGLIQFKLREALNSLIWTLGSFLIGVALMLNPQLLTSVPQAVTSTVTTCVLGALSGQNCMSGSVSTPDVLAGKECVSSVANGSDSESIVNSLNCTVWKSFVLEPWAEVQFGAPYKELYTKNKPDGGEIWSNLPEGTEDHYCVNFASSKSYEASNKNGAPVMDSSANAEVCNVAIYQLFLKTKMTDPVNQDGNNYSDGLTTDDTGEYDKRWYDIIIPMANDDSRWSDWAGNGSSFMSRILTSIMSIIAVVASSSVLLVLAIFGGAYKTIGLILVAFAPVFFLIAMEPTRGRRIFLGWLETLVSSFLKYFAITVLIIVSLVMYAGLLSNTSGAMSLVGIIILTVALHMYRKEITDLIGASNMGGQRLSNKAAKAGDWAKKQFKDKTSAVVGGAIGGSLGQSKARRDRMRDRKGTISELNKKLDSATTQEERDFYNKEIETEQGLLDKDGTGIIGGALGRSKASIKGAASGTGESFKRSMKRGQSSTANVFQQMDRTKDDLRRQNENNDKGNKDRREAFEEELMNSQLLADNSNIDNTTPPTEGTKDGEKVIIEKDNKAAKTPEEMAVEYEQELVNARAAAGELEYTGELSNEEITELDNLAEKIRNSSTTSDSELVEMIRDSEVLNDPNKKALVTREINARLAAGNQVELLSNEFSNLTPFERVEDVGKFKLSLDLIRNEYLSEPSIAALNQYSEGLRSMGVSDEVIVDERARVIRGTIDEGEYNRAVENAINSGNVNPSSLAEDLKITEERASEILEVMESDGVIGEAVEGSERAVLVRNMDEFKEAQAANAELRNQGDPLDSISENNEPIPRNDGPKPANDRPEDNNPKPSNDDKEPRNDGPKPTNDRPEDNNPKPSNDDKEPRNDGPKPSNESPEDNNPKPSNDDKKPRNDGPKPTNDRPEDNNPKPSNNDKKPTERSENKAPQDNRGDQENNGTPHETQPEQKKSKDQERRPEPTHKETEPTHKEPKPSDEKPKSDARESEMKQFGDPDEVELNEPPENMRKSGRGKESKPKPTQEGGGLPDISDEYEAFTPRQKPEVDTRFDDPYDQLMDEFYEDESEENNGPDESLSELERKMRDQDND